MLVVVELRVSTILAQVEAVSIFFSNDTLLSRQYYQVGGIKLINVKDLVT